MARSRSPLYKVNRICRPLLIGHGANDVRCKIQESEQIVRAMRDRHLAVTYVVYPDEGHGFARPENHMSFNAIAEAFLPSIWAAAASRSARTLRGRACR